MDSPNRSTERRKIDAWQRKSATKLTPDGVALQWQNVNNNKVLSGYFVKFSKGDLCMDNPIFAIFAWEEGKVPLGLRQLEKLKGNSTNPATYDFPVVIEHIESACAETIINSPSATVLNNMICKAKALQENGIKGITTSCGFNAIFQKQVAKALKIPFFSSSLLQIPIIQASFGEDKDIIVFTARKNNLKKEHFSACGVSSTSHLHVYGLREESQQWYIMNTQFDAEIDLDILRQDFSNLACRAIKEHPDAAAFLLECTDMPPFSALIRKETGLPVFDFVTMVRYFYNAVSAEEM